MRTWTATPGVNQFSQLVDWVAQEARAGTNSIGFLPKEEYRRAWIQRDLFIHFSDGRPRGFLLAGRPANCRRIKQLWVTPSARLEGIGTRLIEQLERESAIQGSFKLQLRCAAELEAVLFWEKLGFELDAIQHGGSARDRMIYSYSREIQRKEG